MPLLPLLSDSLFHLVSDCWTTLFSLVIGFVAYKLAKFYYQVYSLPPGPLPIPLLGNITCHWSEVMCDLAKKYGPVYTMWMGTQPSVIITDIDIGREAFYRNDIAGREKDVFSILFSNDKHKDIIFTDYGPQWEALRRVAHSAVQKYAITGKLADLASDCVDHSIDNLIANEGLDKPFVPFDYIYNMFLNILANSAFGRRYEMDDPEYLNLKYILRDYFQQENEKLIYTMFIPFYKNFNSSWKRFVKQFDDLAELMKDKYQSHYKDYDESNIRDFCDTLIAAKNEALREGKESAPYLTDKHLAMAVFDLFFAGTDTSQGTFRWILLHMTHNKSIEKKLRQEIESEIGDRMPTHEDRNRCHYAMAFISETMRYSNIVPSGVPHKTSVRTTIAGYTLPADTPVLVQQGAILRDDKYWDDALVFRVERFLENGKYLTTKPKAFIPFGVGRRVCLGEKLAIADLFLVLVRFLQKTSDYEIILHMDEKDPLRPDPNNALEVHPKQYKISLSKKLID